MVASETWWQGTDVQILAERATSERCLLLRSCVRRGPSSAPQSQVQLDYWNMSDNIFFHGEAVLATGSRQ